MVREAGLFVLTEYEKDEGTGVIHMPVFKAEGWMERNKLMITVDQLYT